MQTSTMKRTKLIISVLCILFCSCKPSTDTSNKKQIKNDARTAALNKALQLARQNANLKKFSSEFVTRDSNVNISTGVTVGNLFNRDFRHCIVKRETPLTVYIDVYVLNTKGDVYEQVVSLEQPGSTYDSTMVQDFNNDNHDDLLVSWYGALGCDLKKYYAGYLYTGNGKFSQNSQVVGVVSDEKQNENSANH
jgi:hypothetical protein